MQPGVSPPSAATRSRRTWLLIALAGAVVAVGASLVLWWWSSRWDELASLWGHRGAVRAVAFAPDGSTFASGGDDRTVRVWDAATNRLSRTLEGHTGKVTAVAYSPKAPL